jgi:hypothetical protein
MDETLYVQTRSPGSEDTWVTVAAVRAGDTVLAEMIEVILRSDPGGDGVASRVYAAVELHTLGGAEAVRRAEQQADTPLARSLHTRAEEKLDRPKMHP